MSQTLPASEQRVQKLKSIIASQGSVDRYDGIYKDLQGKVQYYSVAFSKTTTDVEKDLLRHLFSVDEARAYLVLSNKPESVAAIARRLTRTEEDTLGLLQNMAERGLVYGHIIAGRRCYTASPIIPLVNGPQSAPSRTERDLGNLIEQFIIQEFAEDRPAEVEAEKSEMEAAIEQYLREKYRWNM